MSNPQETNSPLKIKIKEDMKSSMKSGDKKRLGAVKLILAAILDKEVETRKDLVDDNIFEILKKLSKKSKESLTHYKEANRPELAEQEEFELSVYKEYLPEDMTQDEVQKMIEDILNEKSISQMSQIGEVMGELKKRSNNRADMGFASKFVKEKLS
ncbi:MAG: GatB/YqeY domain-containing protein [Gammaproteobacteria bacterium]|nr:GatB/YqeY domain-containing protein [Gammaproteobacteria bacterium]